MANTIHDKIEIFENLKKHYAIDFTDIVFHRDGGSISYILSTGSEKYFLRIIRSELLETAYPAIDIHVYLQKKNFAVPRIIFDKKMAPYVQVDGKNGRNLYILYEFISGCEPSDEDVCEIGELVAKLHDIMAEYPGELKRQDKHFFIDRYVNILDNKNHPKTEEYRVLGEKLWEKVRDLPRGYCHCDLYPGNIMKADDGRLYVLDFDTSCHAFPMYDITLSCNKTDYFEYSDEGFSESLKWLERFLSGYSKHRVLTEKEREAYFYFQAIYHYQLQATIVEIYGVDCNENDFEDKQLDWIKAWLLEAEQDRGIPLP